VAAGLSGRSRIPPRDRSAPSPPPAPKDEFGNIIKVDIVVAGYTFDASTGKYKIALVDLLGDNMFHVT
jgi:hypothetical protein